MLPAPRPFSPLSPWGEPLPMGSADQFARFSTADRLRNALTHRHRHLCLVMVGLPGRGKSFIGRKLEVFLRWRNGGHKVELFNVGKYRRNIGKDASAAFFDPNNESAVGQRQEAAARAVADMIAFFEAGGEVGILDATNTTRARRQWIVEQCQPHSVAVLFVESICDDPEVLSENFRNKVEHSPDFKGVPKEVAMADLEQRIRNYEQIYEPLEEEDGAYITLYNLQSRMLCNRAHGRLTQALLPFLLSVHIAPRPIWLCRSGLSETPREDDFNPCAESLVAPLCAEGQRFAAALKTFVRTRLTMYRLTIEAANTPAAPSPSSVRQRRVTLSSGQISWEACCKVMTSTLPRAAATCGSLKEEGQVEVECYAQLNPLNKGLFHDLTVGEVQAANPQWFDSFQRDRMHTRFPGGESYADLVDRLEPCLIDAEQQTAPVLICSHTSVIQAFYAYFRQIPLVEAMLMSIEPHAVYELSPLMGGQWSVAVFKLDPNGEPALRETPVTPTTPAHLRKGNGILS